MSTPEPANRRDAIFLTTDDDYSPYTELLLKSLTKNYPRHPEILILGVDLSPLWKERLRSFPRTQIVDLPKNDRPSGPVMRNDIAINAVAMYAEMQLWKHGFSDYDRILSIDADTLVFGPLDELFESRGPFTIFADAYQGPQVIFWRPQDPTMQELLLEDGIAAPTKLGNCGVFLIGRSLRTPTEYERIHYLLDRYGVHVIWGEQSILNLWMAEHGFTPHEDSRFNFQERMFYLNLLRDRTSIRILHMNSLPHGWIRLTLLRAASTLLPSLPGTILYLCIHCVLAPIAKVQWKMAKMWRKIRN